MKEIAFSELNLNPANLFGQDWMLLTAGNETDGYNTMTVAWGHMGAIWSLPGRKGYLPTVTAFVRPQRYTKEFVDREELFTLCAFDEAHRPALSYLGSHSGRDGDKVAQTDLTPVFANGTVHFEQAKLVLVCRKVYRAPLTEEGFLDPALVERNYPERDFHDMYIGEVVKGLVKE